MRTESNILSHEEEEILGMLTRRANTQLILAFYKLLLKKKFNSQNNKKHMAIDPVIYENYTAEEEYREHLELHNVTTDEEDLINQLSADLHWRHKLDCANIIINQRKTVKIEDSDNE